MKKFLNEQNDLETRTTNVAVGLIRTLKKLKLTSFNAQVIDQLIGSTGSVGANYREANGAESRKDFIHKISIVKKEMKESLHWTILLNELNPEIKDELRSHWKQLHELLLIFSKILSTAKKNINQITSKH